ncbi:hypothetical protein P4O66_004362 [Electrophorus voltai]|uniref:ribonuclease H n=1 Tax=Electrophorus voltai TaxID=2609070 RepID=A0AAD8ZNF6_9TELE|nr:hypothetical protein P4O66_004362 [Electrophorus voltai]
MGARKSLPPKSARGNPPQAGWTQVLPATGGHTGDPASLPGLFNSPLCSFVPVTVSVPITLSVPVGLSPFVSVVLVPVVPPRPADAGPCRDAWSSRFAKRHSPIERDSWCASLSRTPRRPRPPIDMRLAQPWVFPVEGGSEVGVQYQEGRYPASFFQTKTLPVNQAFMDEIFGDMTDRFLIVYIDDILIYSQSLSEHLQHVVAVLSRFRKHHLYVKAEKCSKKGTADALSHLHDRKESPESTEIGTLFTGSDSMGSSAGVGGGPKQGPCPSRVPSREAVYPLSHSVYSPQGELHLLPIPKCLWSHLSMDFITDLLVSEANTVIMVVVDRFSKMCQFIPFPSLPTAKETADAMFIFVFQIFGLPEEVVSDRGSQFTSHYWRQFCVKLNVVANLSSGHHLQSNGEAERTHQEVGRFLRQYCTTYSDWSQYLP